MHSWRTATAAGSTDAGWAAPIGSAISRVAVDGEANQLQWKN
jgi:hypothetical protein